MNTATGKVISKLSAQHHAEDFRDFLDELKTALEDWTKIWNETTRPFKWTKTADQIIDHICHYCSRISGPAH
ncbi:hypothetical protein [Streptomyces sp. 8K308]|uniref:hypothetical protein n=1 Tax=Streptomyces sp. 8K308 TaxID=2530388 RepID=UPI001FB58589|nr:hypothetical protein [Streptomyces sp. 8K308]